MLPTLEGARGERTQGVRPGCLPERGRILTRRAALGASFPSAAPATHQPLEDGEGSTNSHLAPGRTLPWVSCDPVYLHTRYGIWETGSVIYEPWLR